jgi:molecular chaperone GrpE
MKHQKDFFDENNNDDPEEFILSDSKVKAEADAEFEVKGTDMKDTRADRQPEKEKNAPQDPIKDTSEDTKSNDIEFEATEVKDGSGDGKMQENLDAKENEELKTARKKIEELSEQAATANDKYLRLMAEFDNFKRRSAKEYERMVEAANERLMKDITEVRENFERAFKSNANGEKFLEGMKLIFSKLNTILQKHGLEVYAEQGQKFDPEVHDALMRMPHEDFAEGHIVEVHERGYKLKGNIIKHAKVVVSSGKPEKKETEQETVIEIK